MFKKSSIIYLGLSLVLFIAVYLTLDDGKASQTPLSQTVSSSDGGITVSIPRNWHNEEKIANEQGSEFTLNNNGTLWIDAFYCEGDTVEDYTNYLKDYYGGDIIGDVKKLTLDGADAASFEYRSIGTATDNMEALYHGYEYVVATQNGVVELDAYRVYDDVDTNEKPTDDELMILRRIVESLKIGKPAQV